MNVLETRPFKFKKPLLKFICPLCCSKRELTQTYKLSSRHYVQLFFLTLITLLIFYPILKWRGIFTFFFYWPLFEYVRRAVYRNDIPCPYCGFDAILYKKDVKQALHSIKRFWPNSRAHTQVSENKKTS